MAALCERAAGPTALYGHPHSLHGDDVAQSASTLRQALAIAETLVRRGAMACLRPRDLLNGHDAHDYVDDRERARVLR